MGLLLRLKGPLSTHSFCDILQILLRLILVNEFINKDNHNELSITNHLIFSNYHKKVPTIKYSIIPFRIFVGVEA